MVGYKAAKSFGVTFDGSAGSKDSAGRVRRFRDSESYNVKDYGARGDGVTDDTAEIQAAVTAASASGGLVVFPPGTYLISNNIRIAGSNVKLLGYRARLIINAIWANDEVIGWPDGSRVAGFIDLNSSSALEAGRIENIEIEGLEFEGTGTDAADPDPKAIVSNSLTTNVTIWNCKFYEFGREVIWQSVDSDEQSNWNILNNWLENSSIDMQSQGASIQCNFRYGKVQGNTLINQCNAIGVSGNDIEVSGNTIITPGQCGIGLGDQDGSGERCNVHGNIIRINNSGAVSLGSPPSGIGIGGAARDSNIHGNTVHVTVTSAVNGYLRGIYATPTGGTHLIANNLVVLDQNSVSRPMLGITAEPSGTSNITVNISGNTIRATGLTNAGSYGIATTTLDSAVMTAVIANNHISGLTRATNGYAIDSNEISGGTCNAHHLGNICTEGNRRINLDTYSTSATDNVPVYRSSVDAVVVV